MKYVLLCLLTLCFASAALAGKAKVFVIDSDIETAEIGEEFDVQTASHDSVLPDKNERDDFLSGLEQVKEWDEWEKDLFYMNLKHKSLDELEKKYSSFSREELAKMKEKRK